ncbi:MAG TPA: two-component sensor histidine kinase [Gammaproteobacteria bacterium]|nr:two-component sensor histidine kinase [Gammaproteobacteria bacterium]
MQPGYVALLILVAGTVVVFGTSFLMVRWVADPLNRAAKAAQSFRGATGFVPLPEEGPRELVSLASSFNNMAHEIMSLMANRTTLLAGVSHDLRTPLARMRFALELLPEGVDQQLVDRLDRNLGAMDELIEDALRFARGTQEASVEIEMREFLRSVVRGVDKTIPLSWKGDDEVIVNTALGALERVFNNLLANALQHGGTTEVRVDAGENIDIHVIDNGPGIPLEDRDKVFQPFYRIEGSRSRHTGGSGLGLAIVDQLCQAHGWRIELSESDTGGTDARLTVPTA